MDTKETVLVVDDDREIVGAIALALEKEGYRVLRAYDGMEALDHALDPELRLILMDVMMPRLDGLLRRPPHPGTAQPAHHCPVRQERGERQGAGTVHGGG